MLENILGHDGLVRGLRREISGGALPAALLLCGPPLSGKGSIALEVARALSCDHQDAPWGCQCPSCTLHRGLQSPFLVQMGRRPFVTEIDVTQASYERAPSLGTRFLLIRAIRKLIARFDRMLWEHDERKIRPVLSSIDALEDRARELESVTSDEEPVPPKVLKGLRADALTAVRVLPTDGVTVAMVRAAVSWAHTASRERAKVVVIEAAEAMQESARTALLKTLEEPPHDTFFLLTTARRAAVLPTILSRLRVYTVPGRRRSVEDEILRRLFRAEPLDHDGIAGYFDSHGANAAAGECGVVVAAALVDGDNVSEAPACCAQAAAENPTEAAALILRATLRRLEATLRNAVAEGDAAAVERVRRAMEIVRDEQTNFEVFRGKPEDMVERILLRRRFADRRLVGAAAGDAAPTGHPRIAHSQMGHSHQTRRTRPATPGRQDARRDA